MRHIRGLTVVERWNSTELAVLQKEFYVMAYHWLHVRMFLSTVIALICYSTVLGDGAPSCVSNLTKHTVHVWINDHFIASVPPMTRVQYNADATLDNKEWPQEMAVTAISKVEQKVLLSAIKLPAQQGDNQPVVNIVWGGIASQGHDLASADAVAGLEPELSELFERHWSLLEDVPGGWPVLSDTSPFGTMWHDTPIKGGLLAISYGQLKYFVNEINMLFRYLPPGSFAPMGSPDMRVSPSVTLSQGFYMGVTEVTRSHYYDKIVDDPDKAVTGVAWGDAMEWCEQRTICAAWQYSLPTEAQWEWACQAGEGVAVSPPDQDIDTVMWWFENSKQSVQRVAQLKPNSWGLFDMHGNAREWCKDWLNMRVPLAGVDPQGVEEAAAMPTYGGDRMRVRRGGGFDMRSRFCFCGVRDGGVPDAPTPNQGFRVVIIPVIKK